MVTILETIMIRNSLFWAHRIKVYFLPGIDFFERCLKERIIPAFDSIEKEADKVAQEAFENPSEYIDPEYYDPADAADDAFEKGLEYYEWMTGMLHGVIKLFAAGLYHLADEIRQTIAIEKIRQAFTVISVILYWKEQRLKGIDLEPALPIAYNFRPKFADLIINILADEYLKLKIPRKPCMAVYATNNGNGSGQRTGKCGRSLYY